MYSHSIKGSNWIIATSRDNESPNKSPNLARPFSDSLQRMDGPKFKKAYLKET